MSACCRWLLLCVGLDACAATTLLQPTIEVDGRPLTLAIAIAPAAGARDAHMRADLDLGPIVAALRDAVVRRLPRDACRRRGVDNWVARLRRHGAWVEAERLWLEFELDVEAWACVQLRGTELRRRLADGGVRLRLPLRAEIEAGGLRLRIERPLVGVRGPLGDAARWYFAARGEELADALAQRAARLDARGLLLPAPATWFGSGSLEQARFVDAGRPTLRIVYAWAPALPDWTRRLWPFGR